MDTHDREMSVIVPNLAILLLVGLGLLTDRPALESARPELPKGDPPGVRVGGVEARLWQDPLDLNLKLKEATVPLSPPPVDEMIAEAREEKRSGLEERHRPQAVADVEPRVLLLGVMVPGNSYAEDVEVRLRTRYAVLSALGRAQYTAVESNRLKVATVDGVCDVPLVVSFESFEVRYIVADGIIMPGHENFWRPDGLRDADVAREESPVLEFREPFDRVVVLWLDETILRRARSDVCEDPGALVPRRIERVVDRLVSPELATRCTLRILGPTSSDALLQIVSRDDRGPLDGENAARRERWRGTRVLSPRATAADAVLKISTTREKNFDALKLFGESNNGLARPYWPVDRTITTDDRLVAALLTELANRKAEPDVRRHIVLVGEWDTLYSRGLARTLAAHLIAREKDATDPGQFLRNRETWSYNPPFLHEFSYLRGLDGATLVKSETEVGGERAAGRSQFDYLRRLEGQLLDLRNRLRRGEGVDANGRPLPPGDIAAIGVVGSDTYDKLMVLRALRQNFPRAVFFTTDLDAVYLDPRERETARNLVVVSPFGLTASAVLQGRIPPFRDSYQTAMFLTTLQALNLHKVGSKLFELSGNKVAARVFEVGRSDAHALGTTLDSGTSPLVHGERFTHFYGRWRWTLWCPAVVLAAVLIFYWQGWTLRRTAGASGALAWIPFKPRDDEAGRRFLEGLHGLAWVVAVVGLMTFASLLNSPDDTGSFQSAGKRMVMMLVVMGTCGVLFAQTHRFFVPSYDREADGDPSGNGPGKLAVGAAIAGGLVVVAGIGALSHAGARIGDVGEEPLFWFEGTSIWPTEIVRAFGIAIGVCFIVQVRARTSTLVLDLCRRARSGAEAQEPAGNKSASVPGTAPSEAGSRSIDSNRLFTASATTIQAAFRHARFDPKETPDPWPRLRQAVRFPSFFPRVFCLLVVYLLIFVLLGGVLGQPVVPARGPYSFALDQGILAGAVFVHIFLLFFVFDLTSVSCRVIQHVSETAGSRAFAPDTVDPVFLVGELASAVIRFIYYPFTVLFILIISRNPLFDAWDWPVMLILVFGSGLIVLVAATTTLQARAREAKQAALDRIDRQVDEEMASKLKLASPEAKETPGRTKDAAMESTPAPSPDGAQTGSDSAKLDAEGIKARLEWLRHARQRVESLDGVVFQAWYRNPLYRAIMIPVGGVGSIAVMEGLIGKFAS